MAPGLPDPTRPLATGMTDAGSPHHVPVRTILATIGLVLATFVLILIVRALSRVLALVCVAAFFAIVLGPAVDFLERRHIRRGLATGVVFLTGLTLFGAMMYAFVRPIVDQVHQFVEDLPAFVEDARKGRGAVGGLVQRYDIDTYIEENQERLQQALSRAGAPALDVARTVASGLFALVTILVLAFLMLLRGPRILAAALA
ncbi:MAG: AI-2E family transporter, partial [Acidimicrobiales bacterium]